MSTSENSFSFCFWRFDMIENAMSSVSSGDNRGASLIGYNSPPMRITGNEPTFKCKSEAKWAVAMIRRSSILTGIEILAGIQFSFWKSLRGFRARNREAKGSWARRQDQNHYSGSRKRPSTTFVAQAVSLRANRGPRRGSPGGVALQFALHHPAE